MNDPLLSEYIESIKSAEDNFNELSYLRPVLDAGGQPVMTSGNFAVVFKMEDERDGKLYAVKCFTREQEGREEAYKLIAEELEGVDSPYIVPVRYLEKELFVDSKQTDETEFPVLLMDWVDGNTLDKYLRENLDDQYTLEMLAYHFSQLAQWLIPQPFAHGDLKPDNILVRENGTLVLVDYDGMYVPEMKGQKARELGSPDFRHPQRTEDDFDEHIDDFPLVSILLSLKAISLNPQLLEEYGAGDRLLFSENDYRDIFDCRALDAIKPLMQDTDLTTLVSLFFLVFSKKNLSQVSIHLLGLLNPDYSFYIKEIPTEVTEEELEKGWKDEFGVIYSADRKKVLKAPKSLKGADYIVKDGVQVVCPCAFQRVGLHGIILPESVITIGAIAFANNEDMEYCNIPHSVKKISINNPWGGCFNIKKMECKSPQYCIEDGLLYSSDYRVVYGLIYWKPKMSLHIKAKIIAANAFWCGKTQYGFYIKEVLLNNVTIIGKSALSGCCGLSSIIIPESVTNIERHAFNSCSGLTSIKLPFSVTVINEYVFFECTGLTSLEIPNSVTTIETAAFFGCKNLTSIKLPDSLERIDDFAFGDCPNLTKVDIASIDSLFKLNLYVSRPEQLLIGGKEITSIVIPPIIKRIPSHLFYGLKNLKTIIIPNSVTSIGDDAFSGCSGLTDIEIPNGVKSIGSSAFAGCSGLTDIEIPNGVKSIGSSAFAGCSGLTDIKIPNGVKSIGSSAFAGCTGLTSIVIPSSVKRIGESVFRNCDSLNHIEVDIDNNNYDSRGNCNAIIEKKSNILVAGCSSSIIPDGVISIGDRAFSGCKCDTIKIPDSVTIIGAYAFSGSKFNTITIPNGVISIGDRAFSWCKQLRSIVLPSSIERLGESVFCACLNLQTIVVPKGFKGLFEKLLPEEKGKIVEIEKSQNSASVVLLDKVFDSSHHSLSTLDDEYDINKLDKEGAHYSDDGLRLLGFSSYDNKGVFYRIKEGTLVICDLAFNNFEHDNHFLNGVIIIPSSIIVIGENPFVGCFGFSIICESPFFKINNGLLYDCSFKQVIANTNTNTAGKIEVHQDVQIIGAYAFSFCEARHILLPHDLKVIEEFAFAFSKIECIIIPKSVYYIGRRAFLTCENLTDILIYDVTPIDIDISAFEDCKNLRHIFVSESRIKHYREELPNITDKFVGIDNDENTFAKDIYKMALEFWDGEGVDIDRNEAIRLFDLAAQLGHIDALNKSKEWEGCWFDNNIGIYSKDKKCIKGLLSYYIDNYQILTGTESIMDNAFSDLGSEIDYSYLDRIVIPSSITHIGHSPFNKYLSEIVCHSPYFEIDNNTLYTKGKQRLIQCFAKTEIFIIPNEVEFIDDHAFYGCKSNKIIIPTSVIKIGINPFIEMDMETGQLEVLSLSSKYTVDNCSLYEDNTKLISYWGKDDSFTVPDGIEIIGEYAFFASNLKTINLPDSIESIGGCAFGWCFSLEQVIAPAKVAEKYRMIMKEYKGMIRIIE